MKRVFPARNSMTMRVGWSVLALSYLSCAAQSSVVKDGLALEKSGRYSEAITLYQTALADEKTDSAAVQERLDVASRSLALRYVAEADAALKEGLLDDALKKAAEARRLSPESSEVRDLSVRLGEAATEQAAQLVARRKTAEALTLLDRYLAVAPGDARVRETRNQLARDAISSLATRIKDYEQRGLYANALLANYTLASLSLDDPARKAEARARRDALFKRYQVPVTYQVPNSRDGQALSSAVSAGMQSIRFASPLLQPQGTSRTSDSLNLQLARLDESLNQEMEPGTAVKPIPAGTRRVANPEIPKAREELKTLENQISAKGEEIDQLGAQLARVSSPGERSRLQNDQLKLDREFNQLSNQYAQLSDKLSSMPADVEIVNYNDVRYPVEVHKRFSSVAFTLVATTSRSDLPNKISLDLTSRGEARCEVNAAYLEYGIAARGLQFDRSDEELRRDAAQGVARVVASSLDLMLNDVMVLERRAGLKAVQEGKTEEAVEKLVRVVMGTTGEVPAEVVEFLKGQGMPDVETLRGR